LQSSVKTATFYEVTWQGYLVCQAALKGGIPSPKAALAFKL
jgi:hypothetical protein